MIIASINFVIELGMNLVNSELDIPDETIIRNTTNSFSYINNVFYSYNEAIGNKHLEENDEGEKYWVMFINGKTAKFGDYHNDTTSKHINMLLRYCKKHPYFMYNYFVINKNGSVIKEKRNTGEKYWVDEKWECPICYDEFYRGKKLGCNHIFCKKCISTWLKDNDECPYCKTTIFEGDAI